MQYFDASKLNSIESKIRFTVVIVQEFASYEFYKFKKKIANFYGFQNP